MQIANIWLEISDLKSNVQLRNITPAEAVMVKGQFAVKVPGTNQTSDPFHHVEILKTEVQRDVNTEIDRLCKKYGNAAFEKAFPGASPKLPGTFAEIGIKDTDEKQPKAGKPMEIPHLTPNKPGDEDKAVAPVKPAVVPTPAK